MKKQVLLKVAGKSILKNKMRTLLTMLGVIIGVAAVSVLAAVGTGARSQIESQIRNLGTNLIVVTPGSATQGGVSQGAQSFNRLTLEDVRPWRSRRSSWRPFRPSSPPGARSWGAPGTG
jgi:putative ABC transport system permease protein